MSDDQPRRRRRSSISEHIQRVFNVDRPDKVPKKRSDGLHPGQPRNAALSPKSEITIGFEAGETVTSSFTHSPVHSRLPSVSTPGSSLSVHPVLVNDHQLAPDGSNPNPNTTSATTAEIDHICSSPTWGKDVNRKERRATKRLEAERKELEKRLSHLEEAQLKLEQGVYDRDSRRLTKKQPLGSSKRSSSANTERPRSSSFTSLFSSKRSRSRASSVNGSDRDSRSSLENGLPTLPLTLPERFGTAVSRELATRHGTGLVPSHQMPRMLHHTPAKSDDLRENWKMAEEWKKKNGGAESEHAMTMTNASANFPMFTYKKLDTSARGRTLTETYLPQKSEASSHPNPPPHSHSHSQATGLSADLDRESFTAALRNERNPPGVASRPSAFSVPRVNPFSRKQGRDNNNAQPENRQPASVSGLNATRQVNNISNTPLESFQGQTNPKTFNGPATMTVPLTGDLLKKGRVDGSPKMPTKTYKSSPLALNPFTNKDVDRKHERSPKPTAQQNNHGNTTTQVHPPEEQRGRSSLNTDSFKRSSLPTRSMVDYPVTANTHTPPPQQRPASEKPRNDRSARVVSLDLKAEQIPGDAKLFPLVVPPLKHSGRRYTMTGSPRRPSNESQEIPTIVAELAVPAESSDPVDSKHEPARRVYQLTDGGPGNTSSQSMHRPEHSRTPSYSSHGGSSYDTADEEVLDISKAHTRKQPPQASPPQSSPQASPPVSPQASPPVSPQASPQAFPYQAPNPHNTSPPMATQAQDHVPNGKINQNKSKSKSKGSPPLAPDGPITMIRPVPVQRTKKPQKDQVLAKLFVICCSCKYWHDMPSEIYARLACPERLPSESRLARTFSRKSSNRRNSIFSSGSSGRGLPVSLRIQQSYNKDKVSGNENENGSKMMSEQLNEQPNVNGLQPVSVQCSWCGHGMTRSCCQGWTTLVQMRDRHH